MSIPYSNNVVYSGKAFPEISRKNGRITTQTVKDFLFAHDLLTYNQYADPKLDYTVMVPALFRAFQTGILSLNATKQTGVKNLTPVRLSTGLSGKMLGVWAISTISLCNSFCLARMRDPELVCYHCYVKKSLRIDGILQYTQNMFVLSAGILPAEWIPVLREECAKLHPQIRLESMGDLMNLNQARNYLQIAYTNPAFSFGLWTKNPRIFADAVDQIGKPANLSSVLSMSRVNLMDENWGRWALYFDHTFVVVDDLTVKAQMMMDPDTYSCQCGPRSCITCKKCYTKPAGITRAVELLRK